MADTATATLVRTLGQYQLLEPDRIEQVSRWLRAQPAPPEALGKELVRRSWLTPYQVQQLLKGRASELILGSYVILEPLGGGGSGRVFKARHQRMNRLVALKVLRVDLGRDSEAVKRFHREIEVASQLSHPNIVHAYEAGPIGPVLALVMEYVEGLDLERTVERSGRLPVELAVEYIRQAALGLQYAHERGLVHRDIKPGNLVVTHSAGTAPAGLIKILDFGLARLRYVPCNSSTADLTVAGGKAITQGTADYLSPEQALDFHGADTRSDLYSLGCTLYFLLKGRPPFAGGSLAEKLLKHQQAAAPPLAKERADLPARLQSIIDKLLAKQPADRFQTPGELAQALAALLAELPAAKGNAPTVGGGSTSTLVVPPAANFATAPRTPRTGRRRWLLPMVAGSVAICGLGLVCFVMLAGARSPAGPVASNSAPAVPPTTPARTVPLSELVTGITVANRKVYTTATARLKETCYCDRTYVITELSPGLEGTLLIRTACDDKHVNHASQVVFNLAAPATVYVAFDPRAPKPAAWLADGTWHLSREAASFSVLPKLKVYGKKFPAGRVTLGGNAAGGAEATYLLFVKPEA